MEIILGLIILLFSVILHEISHGFVADRLGDPTARLAGRLTLNPKSHIDPFMSILLPLVMLFASGGRFAFGAAKPVPIDPFNLKDGRKDMALVALSGPLTNIGIAVIASFFLKALNLPFVFHALPGFILSLLFLIFSFAVTYNIFLAVLNLLPIPPLDGSKVFALLLPEREANSYLALESIGFFILVFLLFFPLGGFSLMGLVETIAGFMQKLLLGG